MDTQPEASASGGSFMSPDHSAEASSSAGDPPAISPSPCALDASEKPEACSSETNDIQTEVIDKSVSTKGSVEEDPATSAGSDKIDVSTTSCTTDVSNTVNMAAIATELVNGPETSTGSNTIDFLSSMSSPVSPLSSPSYSTHATKDYPATSASSAAVSETVTSAAAKSSGLPDSHAAPDTVTSTTSAVSDIQDKLSSPSVPERQSLDTAAEPL